MSRLLDDGAVDDQQRSVNAGGAHHAAQVEPVIHHRLKGGDNHRHVLWHTTRHNSVDGDALDGGPSAQGRQLRDEFVAPASGTLHELADQGFGRRHDGQTIGPPGLKHQLNGIGNVSG